VESGGPDHLTNVIGRLLDIGHLFGATGGGGMLDASAACVFHLLLIFRWVKEVLTLRLQMGFHKAIL
jgi:hypothetical protein